MRKRKILYTFVLALFMVAVFSLTACNKGTNSAEFTVNYIASAGGYIDGQTTQTVLRGRNASTVTAVPNAGYTFIAWSDNKTEPTRTDINIRANLEITATFEKITRKTFTYVYNEATGNNTINSVELKLEDLAQTSLVVPEREGFVFCGWYLDWLFTVQVSDEFGNLVIEDEIFITNSNQLFSKWVAIDVATYKILMVYVTEVKAILETTEGAMVEVDYQMTETEKLVYKVLSERFGQYLNALLNGSVCFEVDTYFTTASISSEHLWQGTTNPLGSTEIVYNYNLFADSIPEISDKIGNYRSIITTFGMNDYDGLLHVIAGTAGMKYASIHVESVIGGLVINDQPVEWMLNFDYPGIADGWESIMQLYLHEFTHTVELYPENLAYNGMDLDYHNVLKYYGNLYGNISHGLGFNQSGISEIEVIRLFLLNRTVVNDETFGIPIHFWHST